MKNGKNILKETRVLLLFVVLLLSMFAVRADTNQKKITIMNLGDGTTHRSSSRSFVIWDNNLTYGEALIACQYEPTYGELGTCADDFILDSTTGINEVHWIGGFWNGNPAVFDWQITFYNDDGSGTKPGTVLAGPVTYPNAECNEQFLEQSGTTCYYSWEVTLDEPVHCTGGVKYWVAFQAQGIFPPQSGMAVHTNPQQLNECTFKSAYFGFPDWVPGSMVFSYVYDLAFQLSSWVPPYPPDITIEGILQPVTGPAAVIAPIINITGEVSYPVTFPLTVQIASSALEYNQTQDVEFFPWFPYLGVVFPDWTPAAWNNTIMNTTIEYTIVATAYYPYDEHQDDNIKIQTFNLTYTCDLHRLFFFGLISNKTEDNTSISIHAKLLFYYDHSISYHTVLSSDEKVFLSKQHKVGYVGPKIMIGIFDGIMFSEEK